MVGRPCGQVRGERHASSRRTSSCISGMLMRVPALDRRALADQRHERGLVVASTTSSPWARPSMISTSAALRVVLAQDGRDAAHEIAAAAERLDGDAQLRQRRQLIGDHRGLLRAEIEDERLEQRLDGQSLRRSFGQHLLVEDALVGRVLVDQVHAVRPLATMYVAPSWPTTRRRGRRWRVGGWRLEAER